MNILSFPVMIGAGSYESQPRRFRCKRGHESVADAAPQVFVNGRVGSVLLCGACFLELLSETCATQEIVQAPATYAPPPATPVLPAQGGPVITATATVNNPPVPFAEVLRRRREAQGIKPPESSPAAPPAALSANDVDEAAPVARPAPYTAAYRCLSHDQPGDQPSEQFCPPERFVRADSGEPFRAESPV
jgi:hypothetical protein